MVRFEVSWHVAMTLSQLTTPAIAELQVAGIAEECFRMAKRPRKTNLALKYLAVAGTILQVLNALADPALKAKAVVAAAGEVGESGLFHQPREHLLDQ